MNVTDDLRLARVNYVALGWQGNVDELKAKMESAKGFVSRNGQKSKTQVHPKLEFYMTYVLKPMKSLEEIDESIERRQQEESDSQDMSEDDSQQDSEE